MKSSGKIVLAACLGIGAALVSVGAQAEGNAYAEFGYAQLKLSTGGFSATPSNAVVRVGYNFTKHLAAELMGAASVSSDNLLGIAFKVDSAYGAYLKGQVAVAPRFELFAKAGWVHTSLTGSFQGMSASSTDSSFSYAVGAQYLFTKNWYLQGDYASYYDKSGDTIKGPSINVGYRF